MSNIQQFENVKQIVKMVEPQFNELAAIHGAVNYKAEASFALQILNDNPYLASVAIADQDSLKRAIINVAAIGLSLNPLKKHAYLIPRKKKVCLDTSYIGMVQLAIDVGAVKWVMAEIVRLNDEYTYQGMGREPIHKFNPFSNDRGDVVGAYCLAKTHDGEYILVQMSAEEILSIRDRSESYISYVKDNSKKSPWVTDENEMIKKTVIRRASKSWPMTDTRAKDRFDKAIDVTSDMDISEFQPTPVLSESKRAEYLETIRSQLVILNRTEEKYIEHLIRVNRRDIKKLEDLTEIEMNQAIAMLSQLVDAQKTKESK